MDPTLRSVECHVFVHARAFYTHFRAKRAYGLPLWILIVNHRFLRAMRFALGLLGFLNHSFTGFSQLRLTLFNS
jgi:hypothetical protein